MVDVGHQRNLDLGLELPEGELEAIASAEQMDDVLDRVAELVAEHRTTLVFVNTRRLAERLAHQLGERLGDDVVAAHHGSLSKERRLRVETRLRAGDLRALVATASLELGIDIGPVELVCQIGSPRSIATFLQRVGPVQPHPGRHAEGPHLPADPRRAGRVHRAAGRRARRAGSTRSSPPACRSTSPPSRSWPRSPPRSGSTGDLFDLVRRASHYTGLDRAAFDEVVALVSDGIETGRGRRGAYLHHDAINGELRGRRGARLAAATSGGAIPETGDYRVVAEPDDMFVGTVNEDWAVESMAGDIFLLGTHSWQIRKVEPGVVRVRDAGDTPPTVPFWLGEAPARTAELSQEVSDLRARIDGFLAAGDPDGARRWLAEAAGVEGDAATMIVDYLAVGRAALGAMPTADCLVIERFFDDTGGMQLVVHSPHGGRVNRGLGLALRKKFCRSFNFELQAAASDDAVVLSLGLTHSFPLDEVARYVTSATLRDTLEHAVLDSPMFQARWRWNLNRALMVLRFRGGKKNPPPIQRMESDDLLTAVFPMAAACQDNVTGPVEIPDHLLVRQTLDDTLHEALDVDGLRELIEGIETGAVRVHCVDTTEASVLSHEIITARPYAFLDDEETQNRRTNAVYLRRGLQVDLGAIGVLDPDAVEQVHAEVAPVPETADDLHDLLSTSWCVPAPARLAGRCSTSWPLATGWWSSTTTAPRCGRPPRRPTTRRRAPWRAPTTTPWSSPSAGHLEVAGITTAAAPGRRHPAVARLGGLGPGRAAAVGAGDAGPLRPARHAAPAGGRPGADADGQPAADDVQWVARRLLARMHSYSRRARREPGRAGHRAGLHAVPAALAARGARHPAGRGAGPGRRRRAAAGLRGRRRGVGARGAGPPPAPLRPGLARPPVPRRRGRLAAPRPPGRGRRPTRPAPRPRPRRRPRPISVVTRPDLGWLLAAARTGVPAPAVPDAGATTELVEAIAARGACFATDLVDATRRLPTDVERGLWDGVARGLVMCDGFGAIRARVKVGTARPDDRDRDRPVPAGGDAPLGRLQDYATTSGRSRNAPGPRPPPAVDPADSGGRKGQRGRRPAQPGRPAGARRRVGRGRRYA